MKFVIMLALSCNTKINISYDFCVIKIIEKVISNFIFEFFFLNII